MLGPELALLRLSLAVVPGAASLSSAALESYQFQIRADHPGPYLWLCLVQGSLGGSLRPAVIQPEVSMPLTQGKSLRLQTSAFRFAKSVALSRSALQIPTR